MRAIQRVIPILRRNIFGVLLAEFQLVCVLTRLVVRHPHRVLVSDDLPDFLVFCADVFAVGKLLGLLTQEHVLVAFFSLVGDAFGLVTLEGRRLTYLLEPESAACVQQFSAVVVSVLVGLLGINFIFGLFFRIFVLEKEVVFQVQ